MYIPFLCTYTFKSLHLHSQVYMNTPSLNRLSLYLYMLSSLHNVLNPQSKRERVNIRDVTVDVNGCEKDVRNKT